MSPNLMSYLQDHLAGATGGLELLEHLVAHSADADERSALQDLHREITADRDALSGLLIAIEGHRCAARNAAAWVAEKASRLKLLLAGPKTGGLGRLEGLEMLAIGIEGKRALWDALLAVAPFGVELRTVDLVELAERADDQRRRVEALRLKAAKASLLEDAAVSPDFMRITR